MTKKIGLWMYTNKGGNVVQEKLRRNLQEKKYDVFNNIDLRKCYSLNNKIMTENGFDLTSLDLLFHMNAEERTEHQNSMLQALSQAGVKLINPYQQHENARDKFISNFILSSAGIRTPPSVLVPIDVSDDFIKNLFSQWKSIILKPRRWFGAKGIMKFDSAEQFFDFRLTVQSVFSQFFLQKFIPFEYGDYRVEIIGKKFISHYSRKKSHSYKTNLKASGTITKNNYDEKKVNLGIKAAKAMGLSVTIVDMIDSIEDNETYVLEVNDSLGVFLSDLTGYDQKSCDQFIESDHKKMQMLTEYLSDEIERKLDE